MSQPSLGGHLFVFRGIQYDYPYIESLESLLPVCDEVAIILFSDNDYELFLEKFHDKPRIKYKKLKESDFENQKRPTKVIHVYEYDKGHAENRLAILFYKVMRFYMKSTYGAVKEANERKRRRSVYSLGVLIVGATRIII